ncbi:hypothetical protein ALC57_00539 [Trachymyrmex cornetzi]|uniref:Uncharacterized protein n=1 Tax=Trachymyrmex cornetzi TaxID=471704 RepID=A0A151JRN0_9HYME|nr:hypothetical protein ALC57_00539 [Trachymyrmex cornetzi]
MLVKSTLAARVKRSPDSPTQIFRHNFRIRTSRIIFLDASLGALPSSRRLERIGRVPSHPFAGNEIAINYKVTRKKSLRKKRMNRFITLDSKIVVRIIDINRELMRNSRLRARIRRNSLGRDEYSGVEGRVKSSPETFKAARERRDRNSAYFMENRIARNCPSERSSYSPFRIFRVDCKGHYPAICDSSHAEIGIIYVDLKK